MRPEIPSVGAVETDREFKAHIYQHLVELQPYLNGESQISVGVQWGTADGDPLEDAAFDDDEARSVALAQPHYLITLSASIGDACVESQGHDPDLYAAFRKAKELMISHFSEWSDFAQDPRERDLRIRVFADPSMAATRLVH